MSNQPPDASQNAPYHRYIHPICLIFYFCFRAYNNFKTASYKVLKVTLDIDAEGWRPPQGFKDKDGNFVEDRIYNTKDFDKNIIVEERRRLVAKKITEFLKGSDRYAKTIVFCVDIEHAEGMRRELANANAYLMSKNSKYIMQITGDNEEGKRHLDAFINPNELYPVIATTSKLMTTGIDAQTCKLIVLDSNIGSMTEFKQIIGRGTRINEDFGKHYFTIIDFRNVTALFADPEFDGDPVRVKDTSQNEDLSGVEEEIDEELVIDELTGNYILKCPKSGLTLLYPDKQKRTKIKSPDTLVCSGF